MLMEHVIDKDKVAEVDFLIGDDAYKRDWMSDRRERWGIIAQGPRTLAGGVGLIGKILARKLKPIKLWIMSRRARSVKQDSGT